MTKLSTVSILLQLLFSNELIKKHMKASNFLKRVEQKRKVNTVYYALNICSYILYTLQTVLVHTVHTHWVSRHTSWDSWGKESG